MARNRKAGKGKRVLRFEPLESRELLAITFSGDQWSLTMNDLVAQYRVDYPDISYISPTASEQEFLEWVNRLRANPSHTADQIINKMDPDAERLYHNNYNPEFFNAFDPRINSNCFAYYPANSNESLRDFIVDWEAMKSLSKVAPLAYGLVSQIASSYANTLVSEGRAGNISHNEQLGVEIQKYYGDESDYNENAFAGYGKYVYNGITYSEASYAFSAFLIDWGEGNEDHEHRDVMLSSSYTEIGVAIRNNGNTYTVADFVNNSSSEGAWLLGVLYTDADGDSFYDASEGINGNLTVSKLDTDGSVADTCTFDSFSTGGYQIFLKNGTYRITVKNQNDNREQTRIVNISGENVKEDFILRNYSTSPPVIDTHCTLPWKYYENSTTPDLSIVPDLAITTESTSNYLYQAKIQFASRPDNTSESLRLNAESASTLSTTFNPNDGSVWIYGKGTIAEYQEYLRNLTYSNSEQSCTLGERSISIQVFDGSFWSNEAAIQVNVLPKKVGLTVSNTKIFEGDIGQKTMVFTATLTEASRADVSFNYTVKDDTAIGGDSDDSDYDNTSSSGKITIQAGETSAQFEITIFGNYRLQKEEGIPYSDESNRSFTVELSELTGVFKTSSDEKIRGTIIDDDTPLFWKTENSWTSDTSYAFQTGEGDRRLSFAWKPTSSGLATWSVGSDNPNGFSLVVYRNAVLPENRIANATESATNTGKQIRWAADAGKWYIIRIEKTGNSTEIQNQSLQLREIMTNGLVQIDPLWEDLKEEDRKVQFSVNNGQLQFSLGDNTWDLARRSTIKSDYDVPLYFSGMSGTFSENSFNYGGDEGYTIDFDLKGSGISLYGSNSGEDMIFKGTDGNDQLLFENGDGSFTTKYDDPNYSKTWYFKNITLVKVDGLSGEDVAEIVDSSMDDVVVLAENDIAVYGKGHTLNAVNFNDVKIRFLYGGRNYVQIQNEEEDTQIILLADSLQMSGADGTFSYSVQYFDRLTINPKTFLDELSVFGSDKNNTIYDTSYGWLSFKNDLIGTSGVVYNVRNVIFRGMNIPNEDKIKIDLNESTISDIDQTTNTIQVIRTVNDQQWVLTLPAGWKKYLEEKIPRSQMSEAPTDVFVSDKADSEVPLIAESADLAGASVPYLSDIIFLEDDLDFNWIQNSWNSNTKKKRSFL